jgi:CRP/FNR family transcriptional regulator/CRP/FNR family cyclic AMP-dependent transcriptional regulator
MHRAESQELVANIPLFARLDPEERHAVLKLVRIRAYPARKVVVWEGEPGGALFMVLSGYLKTISVGLEGKETLLSVMGPGEVFGELSLLDAQPRSASVVALEATELATIERAPFLELLERSPRLAIGLLEVLSGRVRNLTKRFENNASMDVPGRLIEALLGLAEKHGERLTDRRIRIKIRLSQQDLGNMVGATRESVNKLLRQWTELGLLRHEGGYVTICELEALRNARGE